MVKILKPIVKFNVLKRKMKIDDSNLQMESLQDLMYDAWKNRNYLSEEQRATVLANLVEQIREETQRNKANATEELLKSERADDTVKAISILNLFL